MLNASIIISPVVESLKPVAPNKKMNIAVAAVLGLMFGLLIAFFKEYWQTSDPKRTGYGFDHPTL